MICVASDQPSQLEKVEQWKREALSVEQAKPDALILTKSDLQRFSNDTIDEEMIREKMESLSINAQYFQTSSKLNENENVQNAFKMTLQAAYTNKYTEIVTDDDE